MTTTLEAWHKLGWMAVNNGMTAQAVDKGMTTTVAAEVFKLAVNKGTTTQMDTAAVDKVMTTTAEAEVFKRATNKGTTTQMETAAVDKVNTTTVEAVVFKRAVNKGTTTQLEAAAAVDMVKTTTVEAEVKMAVDKGTTTTLEAVGIQVAVPKLAAKEMGDTSTVLCKKSTYAGRVPLVSYMNVLPIRMWCCAYVRGWLGCLG